MSIQVPEISPEEITSLVSELDRTGYGCVPNYIRSEDLSRMKRFVRTAIVHSGNEYIGFGGPEETAGSGLDELYYAPAFGQLLRDVYEKGTGKPAPDQPFYHILRCLAGPSGHRNSLIFHYDSYVVTALIPIEIPTNGRTGDLIMFPNKRRLRNSYMHNAVDKVLLDNKATQWALRTLVQRNPKVPTRIKMRPGNLYLFWGYRSIHTNEPCDPDKVRATALYHYANPHKKVPVATMK